MTPPPPDTTLTVVINASRNDSCAQLYTMNGVSFQTDYKYEKTPPKYHMRVDIYLQRPRPPTSRLRQRLLPLNMEHVQRRHEHVGAPVRTCSQSNPNRAPDAPARAQLLGAKPRARSLERDHVEQPSNKCAVARRVGAARWRRAGLPGTAVRGQQPQRLVLPRRHRLARRRGPVYKSDRAAPQHRGRWVGLGRRRGQDLRLLAGVVRRQRRRPDRFGLACFVGVVRIL